MDAIFGQVRQVRQVRRKKLGLVEFEKDAILSLGAVILPVMLGLVEFEKDAILTTENQ